MPSRPTRLDRRQFIAAGSAAATLAAAQSAVPIAAATERPAPAGRATRAGTGSSATDTDVLVIGAGLSGLQAASLLEENGARVQVIEARERVGGRVWTLFDLPGYPEVGGNSFGAAYGRVLDRARQLGLPLLDYAPRRALAPQLELVLGGELVPRARWKDHPRNPFQGPLRERMPWEVSGALIARNNPLQAPEDWLSPAHAALDVSTHEYARRLGLDDAAASLAFSVNPYFGSSGHDVSALMHLFNDAFIKVSMAVSMQSLSVVGGNEKLPRAMAAKLRREVHLRREVVAIAADDAGVTATCADGMRYRAKACVCSLPFSVLRSLHLEPQLRGAQDVAVKTLPYMVNTLVFMVPTRRFWESDGLAPTMWTDGICGTVIGQRFGDDPNEITGFVANPRGITATWLDRLPPAEAQARVLAEIERIRPAAKGALRVVAMHSWATDRHAAGDWAVYQPGQVTAFGNATASATGRLHFCGEHTARGNRGMEGAFESGERAAIEVLEQL
ncbi:MAG: NAD(P)/FAD-dependent oxidoreductase [Steroidobacteraceae bacterium]|jgi:monoamine oxidase|nr:NAD(P)/FAD-dependent oxidoreductase [Steroidobacteraceae bacterium]